MSVISALRKLSQEECSECDASLGYRVTPGSTYLQSQGLEGNVRKIIVGYMVSAGQFEFHELM